MTDTHYMTLPKQPKTNAEADGGYTVGWGVILSIAAVIAVALWFLIMGAWNTAHVPSSLTLDPSVQCEASGGTYVGNGVCLVDAVTITR